MTAPVGVTFLGGLGEVGRNCTVIEVDKKLLVIDFGIMFPDETMPGVNALYPDTEWLSKRAHDVAGLIITHAHEDHIGGVARFASEIGAPVFGSPLTIALAKHKLGEARQAKNSTTHVLADGERRNIGPFDVEVVPITHSVPQSLCVIVHSPQGVLVHTGDFKIDPTPVDGRITDLERLAQLSEKPGVRLLLADSTNADGPGRTPSETEIGATFRRLFPTYAGRRLIVSCFASHLHRVQQVIDVASEQGRRIFPLGRSMENNVRIARELGVLKVPAKLIKPIDQLKNFSAGEICIICTGSQGEKQAALALMANEVHSTVRIKPDDVVMLSSHPIPGNENAVFGVINKLCRLGAEVVHDGHELVHTSGHARRDELTQLHQTVRPEWFVPIEGEFHMLTRHAGLAIEAGMDRSRVLVVTDGAQLRIDDKEVKVAGEIDVPPLMFDGSRNEVSHELLAQRRQIGLAGMVHVTVVVDGAGELVGLPDIATRGWIDLDAGAALLNDLRSEIATTVRQVASGDKGFKKKSSGVEHSKPGHKRNKRGEHGRRVRLAKLSGPDQLDVDGLKRQIRRATGRFTGVRTRLNTAVSVSVIVAK